MLVQVFINLDFIKRLSVDRIKIWEMRSHKKLNYEIKENNNNIEYISNAKIMLEKIGKTQEKVTVQQQNGLKKKK